MERKMSRQYLLGLPKGREEKERRHRLTPIIRWVYHIVFDNALISKTSIELHLTYIEESARQYHPQIDAVGKYQVAIQKQDVEHLVVELRKTFEDVLIMLERDILTIDWS